MAPAARSGRGHNPALSLIGTPGHLPFALSVAQARATDANGWRWGYSGMGRATLCRSPDNTGMKCPHRDAICRFASSAREFCRPFSRSSG
ncbi:hypothetical protein CHELA40_30044 [Chelatococcus asaccharovorans]|nr:hypothetical protein CHELA17_40017 [Chelatococcus asaccharovorans]CAH1687638.1 hypothetical protein CHELA40_30044 [Chelatococcus asaccharovorans]